MKSILIYALHIVAEFGVSVHALLPDLYAAMSAVVKQRVMMTSLKKQPLKMVPVISPESASF